MLCARIRSRILILGLALSTALALMPAPLRAADASPSLADVIAPLLPAVVNISVKQITMPQSGIGAPHNSMSFGSGFIIDRGGVIVTNKHVIEDGYEITVTLANNAQLRATVLGACPCDIALLKVAPDTPLPTVKFGNSDSVRIGDAVVAIGNPLGLGRSVSAGIVSALHRDIRTSPFDDYIQTDAAINHGNSGGPLFNIKGEVVGINTAIISPTSGSVGIGFAIPANDARYAVDQILKDGRVRTGWIGISIQQMTPTLAEAAGNFDTWSTAIVSAVDPKGPAAGKIEEGDIIRRLDDAFFPDIRAFMRDVAVMPIGRKTSLTIVRNGVERKVELTVREWPEDMKALARTQAAPTQLARTEEQDFGLHLAALTDELRTKYGLAADRKGVVVTAVDPGSVASDSEIAAGDVITRVQWDAVASPADVQQQLDNARRQNRRYALVLVETKNGPRWTPLPLGVGLH